MNTLVKSFRPTTYPSLFDSLFSDVDFFADNRSTGLSVPAVNVKEDADGFTIELAAPGLKKEDFKINVDEKTLTISSEVNTGETEEKENYTRREFSYNSFTRSFRLPKTVNIDKVEASHENGVLHLVLPKKEEAKPKEPRLITVG
ncbi:Hsp20/alpha crystallin family protein [Jiulongibacter sediminis]|jgi:HSP20 family protein|uniref:Hsp20/alpha crystallin family protein n=1 Tax=Jiulongibacter sediminis TaxID=1605367 RepID=UPI0026EED32A|nr:Hsp20/alpha crystallin family protein [Jiulongibacter sediminis]